MNEKTHQLPSSVKRLLRVAQTIAAFSLAVFVLVTLAIFIILFVDPSTFDGILDDELLKIGDSAKLSLAQKFTAATLVSLGNISGFMALWYSLKLFKGYLRGKIFTLKAAARLSQIGWLVFLLPIINGLTQTLAIYLTSSWLVPGRVNVEISLEDGDLFALAFGLLIVIVGHVMYQAIAISDENDSFV